jgi:hypothetical protein
MPTEGAGMSAASKIARRWTPLAVEILFGAAEAFVINKVSGDDPAWWWLLLVLALIGVFGCGIWAWLTRDDADVARGDNHVNGDVKDGGVATQQSAGAHGQNINVSADNGSFAANEVSTIGTLNVGTPPGKQAPEEPR